MAGSFCFTLLRLGWRRDGLDDWKLLKNGGAMRDGVGWKELEHSARSRRSGTGDAPAAVSYFHLFWLGRPVLLLCLVFCRPAWRVQRHFHSSGASQRLWSPPLRDKALKSQPLSPETAPNQPSGHRDRHSSVYYPLFQRAGARWYLCGACFNRYSYCCGHVLELQLIFTD